MPGHFEKQALSGSLVEHQTPERCRAMATSTVSADRPPSRVGARNRISSGKGRPGDNPVAQNAVGAIRRAPAHTTFTNPESAKRSSVMRGSCRSKHVAHEVRDYCVPHRRSLPSLVIFRSARAGGPDSGGPSCKQERYILLRQVSIIWGTSGFEPLHRARKCDRGLPGRHDRRREAAPS